MIEKKASIIFNNEIKFSLIDGKGLNSQEKGSNLFYVKSTWLFLEKKFFKEPYTFKKGPLLSLNIKQGQKLSIST